MPFKKKESPKHRGEIMRALSQLSQIGITIIVCILIGVFVGRYLDSLLGTTPWLLLIFSFSGAGAAFKFLIDLSKRM